MSFTENVHRNSRAERILKLSEYVRGQMTREMQDQLDLHVKENPVRTPQVR